MSIIAAAALAAAGYSVISNRLTRNAIRATNRTHTAHIDTLAAVLPDLHTRLDRHETRLNRISASLDEDQPPADDTAWLNDVEQQAELLRVHIAMLDRINEHPAKMTAAWQSLSGSKYKPSNYRTSGSTIRQVNPCAWDPM